jgi:hypothetical protein
MKKVLSIFSKWVLALFFLSLFGWLVQQITKGDKRFSSVSSPVKTFVGFPDLFKQSVKEVKTLPGTFVKTPTNFEVINKLQNDLVVLSTYSNPEGGRNAELINLRDNSIAHSWKIKNPFNIHDRVMDPLLLPNRSLCYSFNGTSGLYAIDSASNIIWKQDSIVHHHAMNLDSSGNIWACSYRRENKGHIIYKGHYLLNGQKVYFIDNTISQVDAQSGELLYQKSVTEILKENALDYLIIQSGNIEDPLHINDIQPALKTTAFYNEGDLFISSRNLSCIFQYRPSTNTVIRLLKGPFSAQHDVDFVNDSTLIFFNNNAFIKGGPAYNWAISDEPLFLGDQYSHIVQYNLSSGTYQTLCDSTFRENQIFTQTEGMQEYLGNQSYFIEEQNSGLLWVIEKDKVIYKNVLRSHEEGHHHLPNWIRVIPNKMK